jgi:hypothetical protein
VGYATISPQNPKEKFSGGNGEHARRTCSWYHSFSEPVQKKPSDKSNVLKMLQGLFKSCKGTMSAYTLLSKYEMIVASGCNLGLSTIKKHF